MVTALVLMNVERGHGARIARELGAISDVVEVHSVAGPYDLVAKVQVREYERMAEVINDSFAAVEGIVATETLMAFHTYKF